MEIKSKHLELLGFAGFVAFTAWILVSRYMQGGRKIDEKVVIAAAIFVTTLSMLLFRSRVVDQQVK